MASPTDQQLLDSFRNALTAIAQSQSYTINGRTYSRANLAEVWDMVLKLEARVLASTGNVSANSGAYLVKMGGAV